MVRIALTVVLLASVHPALLAMPVLAVPSIWTGRRGNRIWERAKEATAERVRTQDHLWKVTTTPGPAKEARVCNLGAHLVERHRRLWAEVTGEQAAAIVRGWALRALGWSIFAAGYIGAIALVLFLASHGGQRRRGPACHRPDQRRQRPGGPGGRAGRRRGRDFPALDRLQWLSDYAVAAARPPEHPASVPVG